MITFSEVLGQCRASRIEDDTGSIGTQALLDDRNGNGIEMITKRLVHTKKPCVTLAEELGDAKLVYKRFDALGQLAVVSNLRTLIQHLNKELLVAGSFHHRGIHVLFPTFSGGNTFLTGLV